MSNINTVSKNKTARAMAGMAIAAAIVAAFAFLPSMASAQEIEDRRLEKRPTGIADDASAIRAHSVKGAGIATDQETGENLRSGFRFIVTKADEGRQEFAVERGVIVISVDGERVYYTAVPDSWSIVLSPDGRTFKASGKVEHDEKVSEVRLEGYFAMHMRLGTLWSIAGEMNGESNYDLHYVGISKLFRAENDPSVE